MVSSLVVPQRIIILVWSLANFTREHSRDLVMWVLRMSPGIRLVTELFPTLSTGISTPSSQNMAAEAYRKMILESYKIQTLNNHTQYLRGTCRTCIQATVYKGYGWLADDASVSRSFCSFFDKHRKTMQCHSSCGSSWYVSCSGACLLQILSHKEHRCSLAQGDHLWYWHLCLLWILIKRCLGLGKKRSKV